MKIEKELTTISELMTPLPESIEASDPLSEAEKKFVKLGVHHLPVTSDGQVSGMLSQSDLHLALALIHRFSDDPELTAGEICAQEPYTVSSNAQLGEVTLEMYRRHISSAIVVQNGRLMGIFTTTDACRWIATQLLGETG